jgi:hypothetical protein
MELTDNNLLYANDMHDAWQRSISNQVIVCHLQQQSTNYKEIHYCPNVESGCENIVDNFRH